MKVESLLALAQGAFGYKYIIFLACCLQEFYDV